MAAWEDQADAASKPAATPAGLTETAVKPPSGDNARPGDPDAAGGFARGKGEVAAEDQGFREPWEGVRGWQVLGPFPDPGRGGHAAVYPPEVEPFDSGKAYAGSAGPVRWRPHFAPDGRIDLANIFNGEPAGRGEGEHPPGVAYAVCWVRVERATPAVLAVGSDDGIKVWVNRKLALDRAVRRLAAPDQDSGPCRLAAGWNEVLVKVDNRGGCWAFYLDLRGVDGKTLGPAIYQMEPPK